jgi:hypothetical protein
MPHVLVVEPAKGVGSATPPLLARDLFPDLANAGFTTEDCSHHEHLPRRLRLAAPSAIVLPLHAESAPAAEAAIREARSICPHVPVVVYCSPPNGAAVLAAARAGAQHFVFESTEDLTRVVRRVVAPSRRGLPARGQAEERIKALPALARKMIEVPLRADPPPTRVSGFAHALGLPTRSLRRILAHRGWPPPKTLLDAGRALRALLALAEGEHPRSAAGAAGFGSPRAVPKALRRLLAHSPDGRIDRPSRPIRAQLPRLLELLERTLTEPPRVRRSGGVPSALPLPPRAAASGVRRG